MSKIQPESKSGHPSQARAAYVKPELREYGAIADLTATVGLSSMPDGGTSPLANMVNSA